MDKVFMDSNQIRNQFLDFFKDKKHAVLPSAPVVPFSDPTLLFTNAGMNQFKDIFLGEGTRDYVRAVDSQKCIRVSGKHNDLEEVGHDTYHHTFFEMLGNWSFGDYYKSEAIEWAWELLTEVWKLPKDRLWATVFRTDDEAFELWKTKTDIDPSHILRFDEKDNFWEMGDVGPCGPCSEIHINLSDNNTAELVNAGSAECIEIWNLVFIQYHRDKTGKLHDLPAKHVDTGMGFERICAVLQDKKSNYDIDLFRSIINSIEEVSGKKYVFEKNDKELSKEQVEINIAMRVIADHIRTLTFAIADGAMPSNDGRGYVLRRILRRAARYGRKLDLKEPFQYAIVDKLGELMGDTYPEIIEKKDFVKKTIKSEEESFNKTLDRGITLFDDIVKQLKQDDKKEISGADAFKLYDTFGFPLDLTMVMARELGLSVDQQGFDNLMKEQKERAREATKSKLASKELSANDLKNFKATDLSPSEFVGYDQLECDAVIKGVKTEAESRMLILDKTPFYVESGGQVDDKGSITIDGSEYDVIDVMKVGDQIVHVLESDDELTFEPGKHVKIEVDYSNRWDTMRNHSATHLLHAALRKVLGDHVQQAGSYVGPDRLRFDFNHFEKVTDEEIKQIEEIVNAIIRKNIQRTRHNNILLEEAKEMGALMFFGEKYGDRVNVIQFGEYSMEFCGGTHVNNTSEIGLFKIVSESSIASGVRRIEAVTSRGVEKYIEEQAAKLLESEKKYSALQSEKKHLEKEVQELKAKENLGQLPEIMNNPNEVDGITVYKGKVSVTSMDELKSMGDELRESMKSAVGLLAAEIDGKVMLVCVVSDELIKERKLMAGKMVGDVAKQLGGGGGGRPHLATAGAKDVSKIDEALGNFNDVIKKYL